MIDHAISDHPGVQAQLNRIPAIPIGREDLGLAPITTVLEALGRPDRKMPPVFHVAGTNGKGSTCTYLRYILEAQGLTVHSATKPHLVRYNERIRIAGRLIGDNLLAALLKEALDAGENDAVYALVERSQRALVVRRATPEAPAVAAKPATKAKR